MELTFVDPNSWTEDEVFVGVGTASEWKRKETTWTAVC
jgi:hypothetical protein